MMVGNVVHSQVSTTVFSLKLLLQWFFFFFEVYILIRFCSFLDQVFFLFTSILDQLFVK